ncbi:DUF5654 family protein [Rubrobacter indicoceani]|uniref:DUF5654 family protein n=1 Tax=Rubrobacter indicoceani TaxID=2051957 RepID=UPI000E5B35D7|nr:DUF5654 family protein [Rubrobacter indicoceani]
MSREVLEKIIQLITAAFGLVAALAWNDAIQSLFTLLFGTAGDLAAKFTYAVLVTVVVVFVTIRLGRVAERYGKPDEGEEAGK